MISLIILDLPRQWGSSSAPVVSVPAAETSASWQSGQTTCGQQKILNFEEIWLFIKSFITVIRLFLNILGLNLVGNRLLLFWNVLLSYTLEELTLTMFPTELNVLSSHNFVCFFGKMFCFSDSSRSIQPFPFTLYTFLALLFPIKRRLFTPRSF